MRKILLLLAVLGLAAPALAQDDAPDSSDDKAEQAVGQGKERAAPTGRRLACRDAAKGKNLRGPDAADDVAVCVAEAQLDCLKQAIAQKKRGPERKPFIQECMAKAP